MRSLNREANPDCAEICRRFATDEADFADIDFEYTVYNNESNDNLPELRKIINNIGQK